MVRSKNDTGRRLAVKIAMGCQIGALPRTPFPASRDFPSRGNEKYGEEKQRVIYFTYHFGVFPPFGGWCHMDKPLWGLRVQAPFGARVQRVQRVHRVVVGASNL